MRQELAPFRGILISVGKIENCSMSLFRVPPIRNPPEQLVFQAPTVEKVNFISQ
jgi:hypothetical protein